MSYRTVEMQRVIRFMERAKKRVPRYPTNDVPTQEARLCARLILEEVFAYIQELGFEYRNNQLHQVHGNVNLASLALEACQVKHTLNYGLATFGIADVIPTELLDENNDKKFLPGHSFMDGRLIPPKSFTQLDLTQEIERQIHEGVGAN